MSKSPRRRAREFAVQGFYQHLLGGSDEAAIRAQAVSVSGFDKIDADLYAALLAETLGNIGPLRELITPHVDRNWEEISPIERSILLLGACELRFHPETPYRVIINEAIELAKTYGGTDGHKFVNGVLDKLTPELRPDEIQGR
ncbi:MAG: transcription antitermination factor NusB [Zoogloeaceae bacterium]|nr:transcription antitermination factor NusB [Zoogloeaceae bacterium]